MRHILLVCLIAVTLSCVADTSPLLGTWKVDSPFYRATYQIENHSGKCRAKVLYYNDDTTVYRYNDDDPWYQFTNLKSKKNEYVDAISGATKTGKQSISIVPVHKDTLKVTSYILHKPLTETWFRIK